MKKTTAKPQGSTKTKKGYNEKNPGQPQGAFPPASDRQQRKDNIKSNTADKKAKEEEG